LRKKKAKVTSTASATKLPITVPTIVPAEALAPECLAGAEEVWDAVFVDGTDFGGCLGEFGGAVVEVEVKVEEGDEPLRQVLSLEGPTVFTSELPPWRP